MADNSKHTFEFGLVMAGAISAGAYTAGVVDFLIEALDAWEAAKRRPDFNGPRHNVRLKAMTGASAGAMTSAITAAITAASLHAETDPVHDVNDPPSPARNRFYDAWVRRVDISHMLGDEDIRREGKILSALDASELDRIADDALCVPARAARRDWVADPLAVFLTVSNLRGVPYGFTLFGSGGATPYGMKAHKDHMLFSLSPSRADIPRARLLDPAEAPGQSWPLLAQAALASGAFPMGLRSRVLERPRSDYNDRLARPPLWPDDTADGPYRFLCVDGGLIDNEPLELARRYLARGGRNPRGGDEAHRAVIMVDPFPNAVSPVMDDTEQDGVFSVMGAMFSALVEQARFKPEELALAESDDNYSRFMISPARSDASGRRVEPAMASATLGGFGGFLSEDFRKHDFQLGRRNCQRFLQRHFTLPETNPLFDGWRDAALRREWYVRDADGRLDTVTDQDATPMLPIIPLVDSVRAEVPRYPAPTADAVDLDEMEKRIRQRMRAVGRVLIERDLGSVVSRRMARWVLCPMFDHLIAPNLARRARGKISAELECLNRARPVKR